MVVLKNASLFLKCKEKQDLLFCFSRSGWSELVFEIEAHSPSFAVTKTRPNQTQGANPENQTFFPIYVVTKFDLNWHETIYRLYWFLLGWVFIYFTAKKKFFFNGNVVDIQCYYIRFGCGAWSYNSRHYSVLTTGVESPSVTKQHYCNLTVFPVPHTSALWFT